MATRRKAYRDVRGTCPNTGATVEEARVAAISIERAVRVEGLASPAEVYQVIGSVGMLTRTVSHITDELVAWLRDETHRHSMTVAEGPFIDDPEAAVSVAIDALTRASAVCSQAFAQLERAHIATADIGVAPEPQGRLNRTLPWR